MIDAKKIAPELVERLAGMVRAFVIDTEERAGGIQNLYGYQLHLVKDGRELLEKCGICLCPKGTVCANKMVSPIGNRFCRFLHKDIANFEDCQKGKCPYYLPGEGLDCDLKINYEKKDVMRYCNRSEQGHRYCSENGMYGLHEGEVAVEGCEQDGCHRRGIHGDSRQRG